MKLCLTHIDDRKWVGVLEKEGDFFKVTLFPGSATTDWEAILQPTLFQSLTSTKLIEAIDRSFNEKDFPSPGESVSYSLPDEVVEKVMEIMKGASQDGNNPLQEGESLLPADDPN